MSLSQPSFRPPSRLSPKKTIKPVNFICDTPDAHKVTLVGDFNDWDPEATPMKHQLDGAWTVQIQLGNGYHHYQFLVDAKPTLDPKAQGTARNEKNEKVSLIAV